MSCPKFTTIINSNVCLIKKIVRDHRIYAEDAEDIVQTVFLKAWQAWQHSGAVEHPRAWLCAIARNEARTFLRTSSRRRSHGLTALSSDEEHAAQIDEAQLSYWGAVPEEHGTDLTETIMIAVDEIKQIAPADSIRMTVVQDFYLNGEPVAAISKRWKMPVNTVYSHLHRFRQDLTKRLQRTA